jgi:hypothetical protein
MITIPKGWTIVSTPGERESQKPNDTKAALFAACAAGRNGVSLKMVRAIARAHSKGTGRSLLDGEDRTGDSGLRNCRDWYHSQSHIARKFGCVVIVKASKKGIVDPETRYRTIFKEAEVQKLWSTYGRGIAKEAGVKLS